MIGDPVLQFGNAPILNLGDLQINSSGVVTFIARINVGPSETPTAIFTEVNGKWSFVVSEGNVVANVGTLSFIGKVNLSDRGMVTFVSNTTDGSFGLFAAQSEPYRFFVPQVADGASGGGFWATTCVLANRSILPASATISFWNDDGNPMNLIIQGQNSSQFFYTISPMGILHIQTAGSGTLK